MLPSNRSEIQYRQGAVVRWQGIVSTSKDKHGAMNFLGGKASSGGARVRSGVLMRICVASVLLMCC